MQSKDRFVFFSLAVVFIFLVTLMAMIQVQEINFSDKTTGSNIWLSNLSMRLENLETKDMENVEGINEAWTEQDILDMSNQIIELNNKVEEMDFDYTIRIQNLQDEVKITREYIQKQQEYFETLKTWVISLFIFGLLMFAWMFFVHVMYITKYDHEIEFLYEKLSKLEK